MITADPNEVITFLDNDHVLGLALRLLQGRTDEGLRELEEFLAPETADPESFFAEPGLADAELRAAPPGYGSTAVAAETTTVLVVRRSRVTAETMAALPQLHHVQKLGCRTDSLDLRWAAEHGISVDLVPRPSLESTAEHAVMLILAVIRDLRVADRRARASVIPEPAGPVGRAGAPSYNWTGMVDLPSLSGRIVGLVGMGEVGALVATRLKAFATDVVYTSHTALPTVVEEALGVRKIDLGDLLRTSDVVSLHVPGTPANRNLVDDAFLAAMKPGAHLVNVARGDLIDERALVDALRSGHLRGAALDVHRHEPRQADDPLLRMDRVLLTPHVAGGLRSEALAEVRAVAAGVRAAVVRGPAVAS